LCFVITSSIILQNMTHFDEEMKQEDSEEEAPEAKEEATEETE